MGNIYTGLNHTAAAFQISRDLRDCQSLILVPDRDITRMSSELSFFSGREILEFPHFQNLAEEDLSYLENNYRRLFSLSRLFLEKGRNFVVVGSLKSLLRRVVPQHVLGNYLFSFKKGQRISREKILELLPIMGYTRREKVEEPGEFAVRGEILDFYPPFLSPLRIDLFDDEIEKIILFDPATQLSRSEVTQALVFPLSEALGSREKISRILENPEAREDQSLYLTQNYDLLFSPADFFSFFKPEQLFVLEPDEQKSLVSEWCEENRKKQYFSRQFFLPEQTLRKLSEIEDSTRLATLGIEGSFQTSAQYQSGTNYRGKLDFLAKDIRSLLRRGFCLTVTARTRNQKLRIHDLLSQQKIAVREVENINEVKGNFSHLLIGELDEGFSCEEAKFALITESEIFGARLEKFYSPDKVDYSPISHFSEIKEGDLVVHINHGIGRYHGATLMDVGGEKKDMLIIEYAGNDKLYIPVENILSIQRYIGSTLVTLDKLGGARFSKARKKAQEAADKFAKELIRLYALRSTKKGYAFSSDTMEQEQMEAEFPYPETDDQLRSITEVKLDMENGKPMDRLICGDVGFGKTEVALRAAFKAAIEGKQVALLAPTTILCLQHFRVFSERLAKYPLKLGILSRLTDRKVAAEILTGLAEGKVDLVIGTHKLLQKDVQFSDLGLLIIDEEQRFGVKHKEMLKKFRETVDTLTLTATPIPRTLNMSLSGLLDISMITTPPPNRKSVNTYLQKKNPAVMREAIRRELERNGQVFAVHNKVQTIYSFAEQLQREVPEARIRVGHGQIPKEELENLLLDFWQHKYDVLVATTIIESGIDFPNANTLIVDNAHEFGLSQLYQLRGRIGRSDRQAYAYILYEEERLTPEARDRLKAIATHTALGSGFKIAMQDLEIRGAGNLLGSEQSGNMEAVGLEMYTTMLREAVCELKGTRLEKFPEVSINLHLNAFIPDNYITDSEQKIEIYKKIAICRKLTELKLINSECRDRFGEIPFPLLMLFRVAEYKCYCYALGIREIMVDGDVLRFNFLPDARINLENLKQYLSESPEARFLPGANPALSVKKKGKEKKEILDLVSQILELLS
ncbi:MAG: transcription-repair coupling factor [Candidatus Wallbacteria bacterium]|nr:transcription-repair coupling factor [Candidatus Wallbacteria bacterium]